MVQSLSSHRHYFILASANASLGFLFFTYTLSIFNSILEYIRVGVFFSHHPSLVTFIASSPFITAAISSFFAGSLSLKVGRRKLLIIADIIGIFGVTLTVIPNLPAMITGRLIVGLAAGIMTVVIPLYLTEISPPNYRGQIITGAIALNSLGTLFAYLGGLLMPLIKEKKESDATWRILLGISAVPPILNLLLFAFFFKRETPYFYLVKGKTEETKEALELIYKKDDINEKFNEVKQEVDYLSSQGKIHYKDLLNKKYRKAVLILVLIMCAQQLAPLQIISVYATKIFEAGLKNSGLFPLVLSIMLALINTVTDASLICITPKIGQKASLVMGTLFVGFCTILFGLLGLTISPASIVSKVFLLIWPIPFALALSSQPFIMTAETLPSKGVSIASFFNWVVAFLTVQFFPDLADLIGVHGVFIILGCISIICAFVFWRFAEESEGQKKDDALKEYNEFYEIKVEYNTEDHLLEKKTKASYILNIES